MSHPITVGTTEPILFFQAFNTDNTPNFTLTAATAGLSLSVFRVGNTPISIPTLSDKAADNSAHSPGAIRPVTDNIYAIDVSSAVAADQVPTVMVKGTFTGGYIRGDKHPITGYDPTDTAALGLNTLSDALVQARNAAINTQS